MKLWCYVKNRMLQNPKRTISNANISITYKQLIKYAEKTAETLTKHKYGILCDSELNTAKAILSVIAAGGTCVPIYKGYGQAQIDKILKSASVSYLIDDDGVKQISSEMPETEDLSDVIFIMYTSGTTGIPKGAMITEKNIITNLQDIQKYFKIDNNDRILIWRALCHLAPLTGELLVSLIKGLDIVFCEKGFEPAVISKYINKHGITVIAGTPSLFYYLCNSRNNAFPALKIIVTSGECLTKSVAKRMLETFKYCDIYNVYGLTEASPRISYLPPEIFNKKITSSALKIDSKINSTAKLSFCETNEYISVGYPVESVKIKVENNELLVKGSSIMKGYYNDKKLTDRTIKNGWLHTGDIAEIDEHGIIMIKGRKDDMIIRGGMNIYPSEIENAITQDARIIDAVAVGENDNKSSQKIRLTVVCNKLTKKDVFYICKKYLQPYQYPETIEIIDELKMTGSGKKIRNN